MKRCIRNQLIIHFRIIYQKQRTACLAEDAESCYLTHRLIHVQELILM